jgi:hypothetical protein
MIRPARQTLAEVPLADLSFYTSKPEKAPPAPLTKEMREGKKPLRTFGDLKQFFLSQQEPEEDPKQGDQPDVSADGEAGDASPGSTES